MTLKTPKVVIVQPFGFSVYYSVRHSSVFIEITEIEGDYSAHMVPTWRYLKNKSQFSDCVVQYVKNRLAANAKKPILAQKIDISKANENAAAQLKRIARPNFPKRIELSIERTVLFMDDLQIA